MADKRHLVPIVLLLYAPLCPAFSPVPLPNAGDKCPPIRRYARFAPHNQQPPVIQIRVQEVQFDGVSKLPVSVENEIAMNLPKEMEDDAGSWLREMEERVKYAWQHYGFFKVQVHADARELNSTENSRDVAITFRINEGKQYWLGEIHFLHGTKLSDAELRVMFPITAGELFDTVNIGKGLEAMRKAYAEIGYINFTAVPQTSVDERALLVSVDIDIDEGKEFRISGIEIRGLDQELTRTLLRNYKIEPGTVFIPRQLDEFEEGQNLPPGVEVERFLDEGPGTVCLVIDGGGHP